MRRYFLLCLLATLYQSVLHPCCCRNADYSWGSTLLLLALTVVVIRMAVRGLLAIDIRFKRAVLSFNLRLLDLRLHILVFALHH